MAQQRLCHPDGELAMARAAAACGLPYILSTMATSSIQEVAEAVQVRGGGGGGGGAGADPNLWFQIYVMKRRDVTEWMVREVTALGYRALMVTVDAPRLGEAQQQQARHALLAAICPGMLVWGGGRGMRRRLVSAGALDEWCSALAVS